MPPWNRKWPYDRLVHTVSLSGDSWMHNRIQQCPWCTYWWIFHPNMPSNSHLHICEPDAHSIKTRKYSAPVVSMMWSVYILYYTWSLCTVIYITRRPKASVMHPEPELSIPKSSYYSKLLWKQWNGPSRHALMHQRERIYWCYNTRGM